MEIELLTVETCQEVKITISTLNHDLKYIAFMGKTMYVAKRENTIWVWVFFTIKTHKKALRDYFEELLDGAAHGLST